MCWLLSAVGVVCILVAHEHYSVDVVVAYFITSRLFWWYHTMANLQVCARSQTLCCHHSSLREKLSTTCHIVLCKIFPAAGKAWVPPSTGQTGDKHLMRSGTNAKSPQPGDDQ